MTLKPNGAEGQPSVRYAAERRLTDELRPLLISVLVEELDHWRDHREIQEKEKCDTGILLVSDWRSMCVNKLPCDASR